MLEIERDEIKQLKVQIEEFRKIKELRISSSHDSEVVMYQRDAAVQLSYMVPQRKLYVSFIINETSKHFYHFRREGSVERTDKTSQTEELQNTSENNELHLKKLQMQRERIRELEVTMQEMKQLEETRKISSLVLQNTNDIIPLSGNNNYS